jgi:hypothetical protein
MKHSSSMTRMSNLDLVHTVGPKGLRLESTMKNAMNPLLEFVCGSAAAIDPCSQCNNRTMASSVCYANCDARSGSTVRLTATNAIL